MKRARPGRTPPVRPSAESLGVGIGIAIGIGPRLLVMSALGRRGSVLDGEPKSDTDTEPIPIPIPTLIPMAAGVI